MENNEFKKVGVKPLRIMDLLEIMIVIEIMNEYLVLFRLEK